jgi:hypothetical protein
MGPRVVWWLAVSCLAVAACRGGDGSSAGSTPAVIGSRLVSRDASVVLDPRSSLEWTRRDYERALAWEDADRYCRGLSVGTRRDWRLPEIDEITALYDASFERSCGDRTCHLDPAIQLGGPYLWSVTTRGPGTRFYFDASQGTRFSPTIRSVLVRRVLCVRTSDA